MLVLHIGLVKTGTTFLQYSIFKESQSLIYLHRKRGNLALKITQGLRSFTQVGHPEAQPAPERAHPTAEADRDGRAPGRRQRRKRGRWASALLDGSPGDARESGEADRLAQKKSPPELLPLKALVGIREQDQWLASCYAEASVRFPNFGQKDFNQRMAGITELGDADPALGWLDYRGARDALAHTLGPENVLLLPLEQLSSSPVETLGQLSAFLGGIDLLGEQAAEITSQPRNQLSTGSNMWRLKRDGSPLQLDPGLQRALRQRFAASNRALADEMPLGFGV